MATIQQLANEQQVSGNEAKRIAETGFAWEMNNLSEIKSAWEEMYGSIEKNLSDYYKTATPQVLAASNLKQQAEIHAKQVNDMKVRAAQSGISSPAQDMMLADEDIRYAETKAEVKNQSEIQLRGEQQNFLKFGMDQAVAKDQLNTGVRNARTNLQTAHGNLANIYGSQYNIAQQAETSALSLAQRQLEERARAREAALARTDRQAEIARLDRIREEENTPTQSYIYNQPTSYPISNPNNNVVSLNQSSSAEADRYY